LKIGEIARIGQNIQVYNPPALHLFKDITNEIRPNKSGTAGNQ
jgi:hypothetical protein